jgi:phosphoribosylanthranilate isomerase
METRVKICGITSVTDGLMAAEAGADMIGLMFYEASPRHVTLERDCCNFTVMKRPISARSSE